MVIKNEHVMSIGRSLRKSHDMMRNGGMNGGRSSSDKALFTLVHTGSPWFNACRRPAALVAGGLDEVWPSTKTIRIAGILAVRH